MSKKKKVWTGILAVLLLAGIGVFASGVLEKDKPAKVQESTGETQDDRYVTYNGKKYEYNVNLKNILFLGVDTSDEFAEKSVGKGGQSDTLILLSMNKETKETTLLEISRDSMTDVRVYDVAGEYLTTERMQVTLQYSYGDGKKKSCQLTKDAVSNLLFGIPISSYFALSVDGIPTITDLMGGVKIKVPEDYTEINPAFQKDAELVLNGEQAEQYVRKRDIEVTGSNNQRMERQTQFLRALAEQMQGKGFGWYDKLLAGAKDYIVTDISVDEMQRLTEYKMVEPIEFVPGEVVEGKEHDEFVVNNDELQKIIINMFYKEVK